MARLRYNGLRTTLGASLTNSATAVTFGAALTHSVGTAVPTIASPDYIPLTILDGSGHESEIVYLTAYTSGATTGTIARAKEGTTGVTHSSGDTVIHGPTVLDSNAAVGCVAYHTAGSSIATNTTLYPVSLGAEILDTHGFHDNTTNNSRITVPSGLDGMYLVVASSAYSYSASGTRSAMIYVNGTQQVSIDSGGGTSSAQASIVMQLAASDYVELACYQSSGVSLTLENTGKNRLSVVRVGG